MGMVKINDTGMIESTSESVKADEHCIGGALYWGLLETLVILFVRVLATRRRGLDRYFCGLLHNA